MRDSDGEHQAQQFDKVVITGVMGMDLHENGWGFLRTNDGGCQKKINKQE